MRSTTSSNIQISAQSVAGAQSPGPAAFAFASPLLTSPPALSPLVGLQLQRAGTTQWRAVDGAGRVVGHIQPLPSPEGTRYRARRYKPALNGLLELGVFWSADEAAWCLQCSS